MTDNERLDAMSMRVHEMRKNVVNDYVRRNGVMELCMLLPEKARYSLAEFILGLATKKAMGPSEAWLSLEHIASPKRALIELFASLYQVIMLADEAPETQELDWPAQCSKW